MAATVSCPDCGETFSVKEETSGKRIRCRTCGGAVRVPGHSSRSGDDDSAPPSVPRKAKRRTKTSLGGNGSNPFRGINLSAVVVVTLLLIPVVLHLIAQMVPDAMWAIFVAQGVIWVVFCTIGGIGFLLAAFAESFLLGILFLIPGFGLYYAITRFDELRTQWKYYGVGLYFSVSQLLMVPLHKPLWDEWQRRRADGRPQIGQVNPWVGDVRRPRPQHPFPVDPVPVNPAFPNAFPQQIGKGFQSGKATIEIPGSPREASWHSFDNQHDVHGRRYFYGDHELFLADLEMKQPSDNEAIWSAYEAHAQYHHPQDGIRQVGQGVHQGVHYREYRSNPAGGTKRYRVLVHEGRGFLIGGMTNGTTDHAAVETFLDSFRLP